MAYRFRCRLRPASGRLQGRPTFLPFAPPCLSESRARPVVTHVLPPGGESVRAGESVRGPRHPSADGEDVRACRSETWGKAPRTEPPARSDSRRLPPEVRQVRQMGRGIHPGDGEGVRAFCSITCGTRLRAGAPSRTDSRRLPPGRASGASDMSDGGTARPMTLRIGARPVLNCVPMAVLPRPTSMTRLTSPVFSSKR